MSHGSLFAVIADVHGNAMALEAVLADIAARDVAYVVNLGDNPNGPLEPARSLALLSQGLGPATPIYHVRGNGDRMTADGGCSATRSAQFARERLSPDALRWLSQLPFTCTRDGWIACHGSPSSDTEYLVEEVTASGARARSGPEIAKRLPDVPASLILCGHTHLPRVVALPDGRLVVNPGSVGLPGYEDHQPFPHRIETGRPEASYAVVRRDEGWRAEIVTVPYDHVRAAQMARDAGWDDWAFTLETGRCR